MTRTAHRIFRLAAVLAAVVSGLGIAASASADSGSVGLSQGILVTQFGFSPERAASWTTGACSYPDRPASCYQTPSQARADSVAAAGALGAYRGLTPQQAHDWSVGVCSYADKPSSCYLTPSQAAAQSKALAQAMGADRIPPAGAAVPLAPDSFSWGAAGIGAVATLGLVLVILGLGLTVARRRVRPVTHA